MLYHLLFPNTDTSPDIRISDNGSCNEMIWEDGIKINPDEYDLSNLEFICESLPSGVMTDYAVSDMGCSVVSERLKQYFDQLGLKNIQYFPATIIEKEGGKVQKGYFASNFIGAIDCIDREASELRARMNKNGELKGIFGIKKLVLKSSLISEEPLFRAAYFTRLVVINEVLKKHLEESELTGIRIVEPERWDGINGEI
ncbi:MAG: hypothetical protein ACJAT7_003406 [Psychromonas sp.]|jgi:hypothetical protein|uniref:imm11 family protein n=1 Tax=Psychromonas sp. TaxID=1884585 RepID=UPI0039E36BDA